MLGGVVICGDRAYSLVWLFLAVGTENPFFTAILLSTPTKRRKVKINEKNKKSNQLLPNKSYIPQPEKATGTTTNALAKIVQNEAR